LSCFWNQSIAAGAFEPQDTFNLVTAVNYFFNFLVLV
jgi:hypothetical protein